jgi:hypothetical protein
LTESFAGGIQLISSIPLGLFSSLDRQVPEGIGMDKTVYDPINGIVQPVAREGEWDYRENRGGTASRIVQLKFDARARIKVIEIVEKIADMP